MTNLGLFILRVSTASCMMVHGWQKLQMLESGGAAEFPDVIGIGGATTLYLAIFSEFICAALILIGFVTRLATIPLIITMFIAVFIVHANDGFQMQEIGALYLTIFVFILIAGPGKYSIDHLIYKKTKPTHY
ncbi:DoxX family membrane protein [Flavobacterium sp. NST-5]|uniref:DoxX family membrane protein n=1 Tax=Flavobacterium ichthyis TaxID=2698827 RepID=A0ABW9ZB00_9FLAO|nr:DoxX family protein [Flavobacterium ichthyis]NBL65866.1 DoxX family membrane protein [Flavobacterium ichthyis]